MRRVLMALMLGTMAMAGEINIAVAANVSYAINELKTAFAAISPGTKVVVTLGSSGKLTAQIKNGAPYQLFMAADMKYPETLYAEKTAVTKPVVYARGALAYLSAKPQDFSRGISLIADKKIARIAVANPKTAPYGKAAVEAMKNGGVYEAAEPKFVYAESVSQTVAYAVTAADVGFVATSSLYTPKLQQYKQNVHWAPVDPILYTPIQQGIVILKNGEANREVRAFYDFMLGETARDILRRYGYIAE